jgi:uncharacterized membrane protein (UPF0182 family)
VQVPEHTMSARPYLLRRWQLLVLLCLVVLLLVLFLLQAIADAYTNYLWYRSIDETMVWRSMVETKLGLGLVFSGTFFLACWASLWAVDSLSAVDPYSMPEHDLVRRYQASLGRYRLTVRTTVALLLAIAVGVGTAGQWQHWLMFVNGVRFPLKDPQFGRNVGFYVFRLPFLSFLVDWSLVALLVLLIVTAFAHFLNGSLRTSGPSPRADPHVVGHLSLILAVMALVRAAGYFFVDRYALDLSNNGVVAGADYTDVHVRLPAMSVLAVVSMIAFFLLALNVYLRSFVLPAVAVGLWAFIALMLGVIFPTFVQWLQVSPSESTVELPYIERNILYTRAAFGLSSISTQNFSAHTDLSASVINAAPNSQELSDLPLWSPSAGAATYSALQQLHGYYELGGLSSDRYLLGTGANRSLVPVVIGVREVNPSALPRQTWVNQHLVYTHGYGVVLSPANTATQSGLPRFAISGAPVTSVPGAPKVTQPDVYFGEAAGNYVIVDTREPELDYGNRNGRPPQTSHYSGSGGVRLSGFWQRAAFAMRFHDVNLLTSKLITRSSRIMYLQDVIQRVQHAAPFLRVDSHPYPVVAGGQIFWMVDCYTTTDYFPYSQGALTGVLASGSGLQGQYNYVRDSVKAVVNAYTGAVHLYVVDPSDPLLISWEHTYPGLFLPLRDMGRLTPTQPGALLQHLEYPKDLLTLITAMYGRYHYAATPNGAAQFYASQGSWSVAEGTNGRPYTPTNQLLQLPGQTGPGGSRAGSSSTSDVPGLSYTTLEPFVPYSADGHDQLLAGFLVADSEPSDYGSITAFELPQVSDDALGPSPVADKILAYPTMARLVQLLRSDHSQVSGGPTLLVPIEDSLLYVQSFYVSGPGHDLPALEYVATDFGGSQVGVSTTLLGSLKQLFGVSVSNVGPSASQSITNRIEQDLASAYVAYQRSLADLKQFRLGAFQRDLKQMGQYLDAAHQLMLQSQSNPASTGVHNGPAAPASSSSSFGLGSTGSSGSNVSPDVAPSTSSSSLGGAGAGTSGSGGTSQGSAATSTTSTTLAGA